MLFRSIWDYYINSQFKSQDVLAPRSSGNYTGQQSCSTRTTQRWGDYMSTLWDPSVTSTPSGEKGAFWTVQEYTNGGGPDQSTQWTELSDPLPYFVSYSYQEQECAVGSGQTCTATLPTPAGLQNGDVVIAALTMGGTFPTPPSPPDSTWVTLPIANQGAALSMGQGSCNRGDLATEYVYAHV